MWLLTLFPRQAAELPGYENVGFLLQQRGCQTFPKLEAPIHTDASSPCSPPRPPASPTLGLVSFSNSGRPGEGQHLVCVVMCLSLRTSSTERLCINTVVLGQDRLFNVLASSYGAIIARVDWEFFKWSTYLNILLFQIRDHGFLVFLLFGFRFCFGCPLGIWKFSGQGCNPSHSCDPCQSRSSIRSLTPWAGDQPRTSAVT